MSPVTALLPRIENTIAVTENGQLDLMADIPIEAGEIEKLMNRR